MGRRTGTIGAALALTLTLAGTVTVALGLGPRAALAAEPPRSRPCAIADQSGDEVLQGLRQLARPGAVLAAAPSRWTALVPRQLSVALHDGERASLGWTDSASGSSDRWSQYAAWGVSLRLTWELQELVRPAALATAPSSEQRLQAALHTETLAQRLSQTLRQLRRAQVLAATTVSGDPLCAEAQADAEAALLVLWAVQAAARPLLGAGRLAP